MILRMELSATFRGDAILRKLFANGKIFNKQAYFHFKTPSLIFSKLLLPPFNILPWKTYLYLSIALDIVS